MHAHAAQHGLTLLAEQSVYAQLIIEHRKASITDQQEYNNDFYRTYKAKDVASQNLANEYSIVNLPNTIVTLPVNSIFDYILFIANDVPDFKIVPVDGKNTSQSNTCSSPSTKVFDPNATIEFSNTASKLVSNNKPLFADLVQDKPPEVTATEATTSVCSNKKDSDLRYERIFGNPTTIQSSEVSRELSSTLQAIIDSTSAIPEDQLTSTEALNLIADTMKIDNNVLINVNDGNNVPVNYDTVRAGLLLSIKRHMGSNFVVDSTSAARVAYAINDFVKEKLNRG
nr:putative gp028-like protein [Apis mellifera nudivirus]